MAAVPVVASVLLVTCGLDQLTSGSTLADIVLSTDTTVIVGATKTLVAAAVDGTPLSDLHITWTSSNTGIATVDAAGIVTGVGEGTALVTATLTAPELPPEGLAASRTIVVGFAGLVVTPIDSLTGLGQSVTPTVRGTNAANAPVAVVAATLASSDPTVLAVVGAAIVAKKNGSATITAAYGGFSAPVTVKVRQVAKRITFAASPFVFRSLAHDTGVAVTVVDTRDSVMATPAITWSSQNVAVATVSAAGVLRALQVAATTIRAVVDTAVGTLGVSVTQSPSAVSKTAGDGQTQTSGAAVTTLPTVTVTDAGGAPIAGAAVTFSVASGGGSITGAVQTSDAVGKATVGGWSLGTTSGANSLLATVGTLSATFGATGTAGAATKLAIQQAPTGTNSVGAALAPALQVTVRDANNNLVTTATTAITVALAANPPNATLGGTTTVSAVAGVAAFGNLTVSAPGTGFTLAASATGLTSATTATFNVVGPATKLAFTVQPANVTAGASIAPTIQVSVQDAAGNTITGATNSIALAIGTNPGSGTLTGGGAAAATSGVASFAAVSIDKSGTGYTITATAAGLTTATSGTFNVVAGAASKLVYLVQPSNTSPATAITPAVQVAVTDALGNTVTTSTATVAMAIGTGSPAGTLSGTTSIAAVAGIAAFSTLQINNGGNGYTLAATATGLTGAPSSAFNIITAGPASGVKFVVQPTNAVAGTAISPAITVKVVDASGTTVNTSTASITLSFGANPNTGTLSGTLTVSAVGGVATFSTAKVNRAGGGYTLAALATGLTPDSSTAFTISAGAASVLAVTVQPATVPVGAVIVPPVQVSVLDNQGNVVPSATNTITVAIGTNPGSATLGGTLAVAASNGVATFANLTIPNAGTGYTLTAAATGLTGTASAPFNVTTGSPKTLVFVTEPSAATAGVAITPAITVKVVDSVGATVVSPVVAVTLAFNDNPNGGTLTGTLIANTVNGVATFSTAKVNRSGGGYTLLATATGLASDTSAVFAINTGAAAALAFSVPPSNAGAGATIAPPVQVSVTDNQGNVATSSTASIALAIGTNPGTSTLTGGAAVPAVAGVATFAGLSLNKVANGYTLVATSTGLTNGTSAVFNITAGAPAVTMFTTQPATVNVNAAMSTVVVTVRDAAGNTATSATMPVTLALLNNPSGAVLGGAVTQNAVAGVATFAGLTLDKAGQAYTLTATAAGPGGPLTPGTSNAFNGIGPATALFFTTQPTSTIRNGVISNVVVEGRDAAGNRATGAINSVTLAIGTNPNVGTLGGTMVRNLAAGVATFTSLTIDSAGAGYTLLATAAGLTTAVSSAFDINAFGAAFKLVFVVQPTNADVGASIGPDIRVAVQDPQGNTVSNSTASVTLAFGANPGAATLGGTSTVAAVNGIATLSGVTVSSVGSGYTLVATSGSLMLATSTVFNIVSPGQALRLRFDVAPGTTTAGSNITPAIVASAVNSSNAIVSSASGTITLSIETGPNGAALNTQTTLVNGQATFSAIQLTVAGSYQLRASGGGLAPDVSSPFTITPSGASKLAFLTHPPATTVAGNALPTIISVEIEDQFGNRVPSAANQITITISNNIGGTPNPAIPTFGVGPSLAGVLVANAQAGVATFTTIRPRALGIGASNCGTPANRLGAASTGLQGASSNCFLVVPSPPERLVVVTQPATTVTGRQPFNVKLTPIDSLGNRAATGAETVTLSLAANLAGGHLSGSTVAGEVALGDATLAPAIDSLGTGYVLQGSSPGLQSVNTNAFSVVASSPAQLGFVVPPSNATVGAQLAPSVRVCVLDPFLNEVRTATGSLTVAIGTNPGSATLGGTKTLTLSSGCANFTDLTVGAVGTGYTLSVTPTGVAGASGAYVSPAFNITP
jgi:hypothetical protein